MAILLLNLKNALWFFIYFTSLFKFGCVEEGSCNAADNFISCETPRSSNMFSRYMTRRYILYEVNPGEGFNLRRDVYMRMATLVKKLNENSAVDKWILVLPPWGPLYHWKSKNIGFQTQIKWSTFFDTHSMAAYAPVIEFEDFLNEHGSEIDVVYSLQHYAEGWTDGQWEEKADIRECIDPSPYSKALENGYVAWFWGYENVTAKDFRCLSIQGYSSTLKKVIEQLYARAIMVDRAEVILHDAFGDAEYWMVRKSMVFSKTLISIGDSFRKDYLNSTDQTDRTEKPQDGIDANKRSAIGGPYIAVHLRRLDFVVSRSKDVPNLKHAADQILKHMKELSLKLVFVATDASEYEFSEFKTYIPSATRFTPDLNTHKDILDGGVAIVDQWICAHARYFIGTYESTFSFRIQEEREIMGFPVDMTFNRLCGNNQTSCQQPSKWTIVHQ